MLMYILYICFRNREGLVINSNLKQNKKGKDLRTNYILKLLNGLKDNRINITDYDYNNSNLCRTNNYYYYTPDNNYIQDCKTNINKIKGNTDYKYLPNINDINLNQNKSMNINSLTDSMNCHILSKTIGNPVGYNNDHVTTDDVQNEYVNNKYTLTEHMILGSYNSSCVYLDSSNDVHDLSQISLLFNLGVRYFDFNIVNKNNEYYIVSPLTDNGLTISEMSSDTLTLDDIMYTISENLKNILFSTNFKDLMKNIQPGSINNDDPVIINLNICLNDFNKEKYDDIYNRIIKYIPESIIYTDKSVFNIYNNNIKDNLLHEPINKFKGKVILFMDIYSNYIKFNKNKINLSPIFESFIKSDLSKVVSMIPVNNEYSNLLKSLKRKQELLNFKSIVKENTSNYSMSKDENEFTIIYPEYPTRCLKQNKNSSYVCKGKDYVNNGVNIVSYPFYVLSGGDNETNDEFLKYYMCFNDPALYLENKELKPGAILLKNRDYFSSVSECYVSVKPDDVNVDSNISSKKIMNTTLINSNNSNHKKVNSVPTGQQTKRYFLYTIK